MVVSDRVIAWIVNKAKERLQPSRVILFGSRAQQTHRVNSDYDIAIVPGATPMTQQQWDAFLHEVDEHAPTLNQLDILCLDERLSQPLRSEIERTGIRVDDG